MNKGRKLWFDSETGDVWYGKDEDNLVSAEGVELSSGYKTPGHLYVADMRKAFLLGMKVARDRLTDEF